MPVGMSFVGRFAPKAGAQKQSGVGDQIGQAVDTVGEQRMAVAEFSEKDLKRR